MATTTTARRGCTITEAQRQRAAELAQRALDATTTSGAEAKLAALSAQSTEGVARGATTPLTTQPLPSVEELGLKKRHDLIAYYRLQGLEEEDIVARLADHGFKIKVADVRANAKWYGTEKIAPHEGLVSQFPQALGSEAAVPTLTELTLPVNPPPVPTPPARTPWDQLPRVDTSALPLARGASWQDLNSPEGRQALLEMARRGTVPTPIEPAALRQLEALARNPAYLLDEAKDVYVALDSPTLEALKAGDTWSALGARSMTAGATPADLARVRSYGGTIFKVHLPKGTLAVPAKVFGVNETVLLPGAKFRVESIGADGVRLTTLIDDGRTYVADLGDFIRQLRAAAPVAVPPIVPPLPPAPAEAPYEGAKARNYLRKSPKPDLTPEELEALDSYQGGPYQIINHIQRRFQGDLDAHLKSAFDITDRGTRDYITEAIVHGRAALAKAPQLGHDIIVYRTAGLPSDIAFTREEMAKLLTDNSLGVGVERRAAIERLAAEKLQGLTGGTIEDRGFVSTTVSRSQAERWAERTRGSMGDYRPNVLFRIHLPKGTRGLWMEHVADQSQFVVKQEYLLGASKFKVTNVTAVRSGYGHLTGALEIDLELILPEAATTTLGAAVTAEELVSGTRLVPVRPLTAIEQASLTKRHDLIAYYRARGLDEQEIVEELASHGFTIKVADVRANAKWYGTAKIPPNKALVEAYPDVLGTEAKNPTVVVKPKPAAPAPATPTAPPPQPAPRLTADEAVERLAKIGAEVTPDSAYERAIDRAGRQQATDLLDLQRRFTRAQAVYEATYPTDPRYAELKAAFEKAQSELEAARKAMPQLVEQLKFARDRGRLARIERRERALTEVLAQDAGATVKVRTSSTATLTRSPARKRAVDDATRWLERVLGPRAAVDVQYKAKSGGRPYYVAAKRLIAISDHDTAASVVHEIGHDLEVQQPGWLRKAIEYRASRTQGDKLERLQALQRGYGYAAHEVTLKDKFTNPYIGKVYERDRATEIISMGLELMYEDAAWFAANDPGYFKFIYDLLREAR